MDKLPLLALSEIFGFLNIQEKLKLRSTCKKWKFVLESFGSQQNLCIYSTEYPYNESWCWSGTRVVEEDLLYLKFDRENSRRFDLRKQFFRNLRKVYLHEIGHKIDYFLEEVHLLAKLKVLMVQESLGRIKLRKLSSSSLEKFSFKGSSIHSLNSIELDMPKLRSFALANRFRRTNDCVRFRFPMTVRHLECECFNSTLSVLKNLETLICREITINFKLNDFKRLTRLELFPDREEKLQEARNICEERRRLERDSLEIVISGFKADFALSASSFPLAFSPGPNYFDYVVQNYSQLVSRFPKKLTLRVSDLLKWANSIPANFFDKFPEILWIDANDNDLISESEQSNLIELIRRSNPKMLMLPNVRLKSELKSEFYEQISSVLSISSFSVGPNLEGVDFDHFLRLRHLSRLEIRFNKISLQFVCKLFEQLKLLGQFEFFSTSSPFEIRIHFERLPLEELIEMGLAPEEIDFSRPYELSYERPVGYSSVIRHCKDVNGLVRQINRMKEDATLKDCWI